MESSIKDLRNRTGLSQVKFATMLGVSVASLRRWEAGDTRPSPMAIHQIEEFEKMSDTELLEIGNNYVKPIENIPGTAYSTSFSWKGKKYDAQWAPYVINGPSDQKTFYEKLIELQENADLSIDFTEYCSRLSMLQSVNGTETAQFLMEAPKSNAKSWTSDYGTHGFHRYVGRFPSHVIRALINAFGATSKDTILDPFCGSGTTLVESRMLGVNAVGIEISPLSSMMSRVKSSFPLDGMRVSHLVTELSSFYNDKWNSFVDNKDITEFSYEEILDRVGNKITKFSNIEKWFSKDALLGTSIIVEFIMQKTGYVKDFITIALSSKMRSIGNVDVDVVRAEYRKEPRQNVDVLKLVLRQIQKMASGINCTLSACKNTITGAESIKIIEGSVLNAEIAPNSISHIITSPPYGVESLSYLRTHLLSFRALEPILGVDPYNFGDGIIGSEYLGDSLPDTEKFKVAGASKTYKSYFASIYNSANSKKEEKRIVMMMQFFEDMYEVVERFSRWLKPDGKVAFVIGNKKLGDSIIPTDKIIEEIFSFFGFRLVESIAHKLKTNNSNSQVPWQERIIENEYIMIFERKKK